MGVIDLILMVAGVLVILACSLEISTLKRRVEYLFWIAIAIAVAGLLVQSELIIYQGLLTLFVCFVVKEQAQRSDNQGNPPNQNS